MWFDINCRGYEVSLKKMKQIRRAYRKHFVEENKNGNLIKYPVKEWAFNHQSAFPNYQFSNTTTDCPTTSQIVAVMIGDFGYTKTEANGEVILRK